MKYSFRLNSSDEVIHLTQEQIDLIPYLSRLMLHKDDFVSIANQNGEYDLNLPIEYHSLTAIVRSITSNNPYKLFDELPEDENVFNTLRLFDYLGLQPFPLPLLKEANSIRSKSIQNEGPNKRIRYHEANVSEVRRTAAEFLIALMKTEYKLHDSNTMETIFILLNVILYNAGVFNLRFRDHTLVIAKKCCYQFLTKTQRRQLETSHRLPQYVKIYSEKFQNTFTSRGSYVTIEKKMTQVPSTTLHNPSNTYTFPRFESYRPLSWDNHFNTFCKFY